LEFESPELASAWPAWPEAAASKDACGCRKRHCYPDYFNALNDELCDACLMCGADEFTNSLNTFAGARAVAAVAASVASPWPAAATAAFMDGATAGATAATAASATPWPAAATAAFMDACGIAIKKISLQ
jgi:hypothetical protein